MKKTLIAISSNKSDIKNIRILAHPFNSDKNSPVLYGALVTTSDLLSAYKTIAQIDESAIRVDAQILRAGSTIFIDALFSEPIHYLVEIAADDYSGNAFAVPGCSNTPTSIRTLPTKPILKYRSTSCGTAKDGSCEIPAFLGEFKVDADGIQPTFEEIIISGNRRLYGR